jgi:hypothetical protein
MYGKHPISAALNSERGFRRAQRLVTAIKLRLLMIASWARQAQRATGQDASLLEITEGRDSALALRATADEAEKMDMVAHRSSLEEFLEAWESFRRKLHVTMAFAIVAQEDVETAAIGRLVRASCHQVDHTAWGQLLALATCAGWEDSLARHFDCVAFEETYLSRSVVALHGNLPSYRASLFSTIVHTSITDMLVDIDVLDDLLGLPGRPGHTSCETRIARELAVAGVCQQLRQRGADLVPTELHGLLAVVSTESAIHQEVCAFLFYSAVVTAGISGRGRFVRFYPSPAAAEVLPLRNYSVVVPELADEAKVWIDVPLRQPSSLPSSSSSDAVSEAESLHAGGDADDDAGDDDDDETNRLSRKASKKRKAPLPAEPPTQRDSFLSLSSNSASSSSLSSSSSHPPLPSVDDIRLANQGEFGAPNNGGAAGAFHPARQRANWKAITVRQCRGTFGAKKFAMEGHRGG